MSFPRWNTSSPLFSVVSLLLLLAVSVPGMGQDTKPASAKPVTSKSTDKAVKAWTCPMCPQIHQPSGGYCPICSMRLVSASLDGGESPLSLDEMLTIALQHTPDVRAARAKLLAAEAELDRTRLTVLQQIIAYRERWSAHKAALTAATEEVRTAQSTATPGDLSEAQKTAMARLLATARRKLAFEQARLKEVEAQQPFLLGSQGGHAGHDNSDAETAVIKDRLIPMIEQLIKVTTEDYQKGQAELSDTISWSRRLAELKVQTVTTKTEQSEIVQAHIILLKDMQEMAAQRYKAGAATMKDVLAAQIQVAEAELWLAKVKNDAP